LLASLENDKKQSGNISESQHANISANYFENDVQSATTVNKNATACDGSGGGVVNLKWDDTTAAGTIAHSVSYVQRTVTVAPGNTQLQLRRIVCAPASNAGYQVLSDSVASVALTCVPAVCTSPLSLTMTVTQAPLTGDAIQSTTPQVFSVTGQVRQTSQGGGGTVSPPLLLLGGGNCNQAGIFSSSGSGGVTIIGSSAGEPAPYVNSCNPDGVDLQDNGFTSPYPIQMPPSGGCGGGHCTSGQVQNTTTTYADPYSTIPAPTAACTTTYTSNATISGNIGPGIYCVTGSSTQITFNKTIASNAMFYFGPNTPTPQFNNDVTVTPPTSGQYAGFAFFWRPTGNPTLNLKNVTWSSTTGIFYAPTLSLTLGPGATTEFDSAVVVLQSFSTQAGSATIGQ
jgi:hypothetical protein